MPTNEPYACPPQRHLLWRVVVFVTLFAALQSAYSGARGGRLERAVIDVATVRTAAVLINTLSPEIGVRSEGPRLRAEGGGLNVLNGCEGIEAAFLLVAAMVVAPMAWRWRLLGLLAGLPLVFVLNQGRVLALFYAFRSDRALFDLLHGTLAPLLLIVAVGGFFTLWLTRFGAQHQPMQVP